MIKFQKKVFKNGLRAIVAPMGNTEAVTLLVLVATGSRNEAKDIGGISHFLEHLFFKGTKSRPTPGQIHSCLDRIGAAYNAFTSKEYTGFWVKSASSDFDVSLDVVSDILLEPIFDKNEIEKERNVIFQEKNMREDLPHARAADIFENVLYGDTPLGRDIIGTDESIKNIRRQEIIDYLKDHYFASNAVVVVAGNVDGKSVFSKLEKAFKSMSKGKVGVGDKSIDAQTASRIKLIDKKTDQMHFVLGFRACDIFSPKKYGLGILSTVLGGNLSSRLWMEIREKLGLAYYVGSEKEHFTDAGYLKIHAGVPHESLQKVLIKVVETAAKIKKIGVSEKELKDAKNFTRGRLALSLESSDEVAAFYGEQELLLKKILQPEDVLEKIGKVDRNDILNIGRKVFNRNKISLVAIGQHHFLKDAEKRYKQIFNKI